MNTILVHMRANGYSRHYEPVLPSEPYLIQGKQQYRSKHDEIPAVADSLRFHPDIYDIAGDERMIYVMVRDPNTWQDIEPLVLKALVDAFHRPGTPEPEIIRT